MSYKSNLHSFFYIKSRVNCTFVNCCQYIVFFMEAQDCLLDRFINALHGKTEKRRELVQFISETLHIEKESASRRLNKKVYFSIDEMGILSTKLGISLDLLQSYDKGFPHLTAYSLQAPMSLDSMNSLTLKIETSLHLLKDLCREPTEYGAFFSSLPIVFQIPYKNLLKFTYFKWGYYHIGPEKFSEYSSWSIPKEILDLNPKITDVCNKWTKVLYLWDISTIWNLVKDIKYFKSTYILDQKNAELIKKDLHEMLYNIENAANQINNSILHRPKSELYVSSVNLGANHSYFISPNRGYCASHSHFVGLNYSDNYDMCLKVQKWINSMKKICTLISGCGIKGRRMFFYDQHETVDTI